MKKLMVLALAVAAALPIAGCETQQQQNAAGGALLGGAAGALIGSAVDHGHAGGAVVGGVLGAATGAMVGSAATPSEPARRCAEWYYDYYGNRVCRNWY